ncbi:hypothetical protein [Nakamurella leprariae]|uniref:Uncharacterized protein n=1 Tax=Nakamurella leprariae TaxID=2803911 RepID=A0A938YE69_9ACTN|nr:hypothetical protein [Nakamurella leprariae]MBM9466128.1 hypothetical protein [Nakamurella leprariae]
MTSLTAILAVLLFLGVLCAVAAVLGRRPTPDRPVTDRPEPRAHPRRALTRRILG